MPKPHYPPALVGVSGKVRVSLNIHNDGSVSDVKVLSATHDEFAEAAKAAVRQWRFKPWDVTTDLPAVVEAQNTLVFSPEPNMKAVSETQNTIQTLLSQRCNALNTEVAQYRGNYPDKPLSSMPTFAMTSAALLIPVFTHERKIEEGSHLNSELLNALPDIVRRCQSTPTALYSDVLPESVKKAFWLPR
ncbi:energy transducer TonB [Pseudomonas purpurea]|uniref:energy transducer TonB n=1 Tax=Pseudomonas purpurea TaxID=3136737 RepID=UPI003264D044